MKETFYFSHDYTAQEDDKIKKLLYKLKWEGYGLYWAIIEALYLNEGKIEYDCERIAFELRTDEEKIKSVINDFKLFQVASNFVTSRSVTRRLNQRKSKSEKARKSAMVRWEISDANALHTLSDRNAIKERKGKENKGKEIQKETSKEKIPPTQNQVEEYFLEKKSGKEEAEAFFDYYQTRGWKVGRANTKMKDWKASVRNWLRNTTKFRQQMVVGAPQTPKGSSGISDNVKAIRDQQRAKFIKAAKETWNYAPYLSDEDRLKKVITEHGRDLQSVGLTDLEQIKNEITLKL